MATIDQRGKYWRARIRIPGFKLKTRSFDTESQARTWAARKEAELRAGKDTIPDSRVEMTVGEALERYLKEITPSKKGREQEERRVRAWLRRTALVRLKLSDLKSAHLTEFKKDRKQEGASSNTIRLDLALISNLYTIARKEWNLAYLQNPVSEMRMPPAGKPRNRILSTEERTRLVNALRECRDPLVLLVVKFALETAARQGEILGLSKSDVDLRKRVAVFRDTKNGTDRAIPLSQGAMEVLHQVDLSPGSDTVFPITRDALVAAWRRALRRANIKNFRFHDLRHVGTTALFERGLQVMEVQGITGHKTLKILLNYTHMNPSHIVDRLDETEARSERPANRRGSYESDTALTAHPKAQGHCVSTNAPDNTPNDGLTANPARDLGQAVSGANLVPGKVIEFPKRR